MFEHRREKLLSLPLFVRRLAICLLIASGMVLVGVGVGVLGYHHFAGFSWVDSLLNACMILTGMGPVGGLPTDEAKIFASLYALFSGLVFISVMAVMISPIMHRILHKFHLAEEDFGEGDDGKCE
jgi:peptidoglycan biosynthesis protein MviN/MurJ (putative lipid II flippase)